MSRGGALGAEAPRTRGPRKKKKRRKKKKERKKEKEKEKERKEANDNEKHLIPTPAKWIKYPAMGPYVGRAKRYAPTILGVCVCVFGG